MKRKLFVFILALSLALSLSVTVMATSATKPAVLNYSDIKITLDGQSVTPKDANGNIVEPFIIDGTTYLPVRAVADALGLNVEWDGSTKTVKLGTGEVTLPAPSNPLDLSGLWRQVNVSDGTMYHEAIISGGVIEIYWVSDLIDSVYWVGSCPIPTGDPFTWTSTGDTARMNTALLASTDEFKDFTYNDGRISYSVTALGITATFTLERVETTSNSIGSKTSTLSYSDIKITLNGQYIEPKDANGNTVEPFIIDGTTYLPVRAVANALGLDVQWDSVSKTVILNTGKHVSPPTIAEAPTSESSSSEFESADPNWLDKYNYVASSESNRYHLPRCRWTSEINEENLIAFDSIAEAEAAGYIACKVCQ